MTLQIEIDLGDDRLDGLGELLAKTQAAAFVRGYLSGQTTERIESAAAMLCAANKCPDYCGIMAQPPEYVPPGYTCYDTDYDPEYREPDYYDPSDF